MLKITYHSLQVVTLHEKMIKPPRAGVSHKIYGFCKIYVTKTFKTQTSSINF